MSKKNNLLIKQLNNRKAKLELEIEQLSLETREAQRKLSKAQTQLQNITEQLSELKNKEINITDHALLRYIERVMKINTEEIRETILDAISKEVIISYGSGKYPLSEEHYIVVKGVDIVSIV